MKIERNINKRLDYINSLKHEVKCTFDAGIKHKQTHAEILSRIKSRVYDNVKYKKIGVYGRGLISGFIDANFDNMYRLTSWNHWYNGKFVGNKLPYGDNFKQDLVVSHFVYNDTEIIYS